VGELSTGADSIATKEIRTNQRDSAGEPPPERAGTLALERSRWFDTYSGRGATFQAQEFHRSFDRSANYRLAHCKLVGSVIASAALIATGREHYVVGSKKVALADALISRVFSRYWRL